MHRGVEVGLVRCGIEVELGAVGSRFHVGVCQRRGGQLSDELRGEGELSALKPGHYRVEARSIGSGQWRWDYR